MSILSLYIKTIVFRGFKTMEMQKLAVKEQIVKTVVKSGNGGAVWVPKGWLGKAGAEGKDTAPA